MYGASPKDDLKMLTPSDLRCCAGQNPAADRETENPTPHQGERLGQRSSPK